MSERVKFERRMMAAERMVAQALPRQEFLLFVESTKDSIAKFHTVTFKPVATRSVVGLVLACVALSMAIALLVVLSVWIYSH